VGLRDVQHLFNADVDMYIHAVVRTVVRIQAMECIQQHAIPTAVLLAQL